MVGVGVLADLRLPGSGGAARDLDQVAGALFEQVHPFSPGREVDSGSMSFFIVAKIMPAYTRRRLTQVSSAFELIGMAHGGTPRRAVSGGSSRGRGRQTMVLPFCLRTVAARWRRQLKACAPSACGRSRRSPAARRCGFLVAAGSGISLAWATRARVLEDLVHLLLKIRGRYSGYERGRPGPVTQGERAARRSCSS